MKTKLQNLWCRLRSSFLFLPALLAVGSILLSFLTVTVAGVVFSITIVVLSLASSQFEPRLIRNFMSVRANQLVLGSFVATYTYGVMTLWAVDATVEARFVPSLSVTVAIAASLASIAVLIYFIHSVSESIQAQNIINRVSRALEGAAKGFSLKSWVKRTTTPVILHCPCATSPPGATVRHVRSTPKTADIFKPWTTTP